MLCKLLFAEGALHMHYHLFYKDGVVRCSSFIKDLKGPLYDYFHYEASKALRYYTDGVVPYLERGERSPYMTIRKKAFEVASLAAREKFGEDVYIEAEALKKQHVSVRVPGGKRNQGKKGKRGRRGKAAQETVNGAGAVQETVGGAVHEVVHEVEAVHEAKPVVRVVDIPQPQVWSRDAEPVGPVVPKPPVALFGLDDFEVPEPVGDAYDPASEANPFAEA